MLRTASSSVQRNSRMNKLLSVIVPCYNMEACVASCLDTIVGDERVEVIAVNDGSRDSTLSIIEQYVLKYPDTCKAVDKPNGNYGSAINAGLKVSTGKYVRILDADDCFIGSGLIQFLDILEKSEDCDIVLSPFIQVGNREERIWFGKYGKTPFITNQVLQFDEILAKRHIEYLMMHTVTYRRSLLHEINYRQTEGISYTDQEWVFYPLFHLKTIMFTNTFIYRYTLGREGQTMDAKVLAKSIGQLMRVTENMCEYTARNIELKSISAERRNFLLSQISHRMSVILRILLFDMDDTTFGECEFTQILSTLRQWSARLHISKINVVVNPILRFDLLRYWEKHNRRPRKAILGFMRRCDALMKRVYSLIFR